MSTEPEFDIERIREILPHRYPFLLIDRVLEVESDQRIKALKNITMNEPFFTGHFPKKPVMPGVLIIECFAQAAALLGANGMAKGKIKEDSLFYLVGVDKARFRKPTGPGDQLFIEVKFITERRNIYKYEASAHVDDKLVAAAELLTTVID